MTINDCRNNKTSGNTLSFLNGLLGSATSMNTAWEGYLNEAGVTEGSLNDRQFSYLRDAGYTGTLSDMLAAWWCDLSEDDSSEELPDELPEVTTQVATLDGTQYWQLSSPIVAQTGDVVEFSFKDFTTNGSYCRFFGDTGYSFSLDSGATGAAFRIRSLTSALLNGVAIVTDVTPIPTGINTVSCVLGAAGTITSLLALGSSNITRAAMYNFKLIRAGTLLHEIALTNKDQGAIQLAATGSVNATMINYNISAWGAL